MLYATDPTRLESLQLINKDVELTRCARIHAVAPSGPFRITEIVTEGYHELFERLGLFAVPLGGLDPDMEKGAWLGSFECTLDRLWKH